MSLRLKDFPLLPLYELLHFMYHTFTPIVAVKLHHQMCHVDRDQWHVTTTPTIETPQAIWNIWYNFRKESDQIEQLTGLLLRMRAIIGPY